MLEWQSITINENNILRMLHKQATWPRSSFCLLLFCPAKPLRRSPLTQLFSFRRFTGLPWHYFDSLSVSDSGSNSKTLILKGNSRIILRKRHRHILYPQLHYSRCGWLQQSNVFQNILYKSGWNDTDVWVHLIQTHWGNWKVLKACFYSTCLWWLSPSVVLFAPFELFNSALSS